MVKILGLAFQQNEGLHTGSRPYPRVSVRLCSIFTSAFSGYRIQEERWHSKLKRRRLSVAEVASESKGDRL
jgi:hypothetical protein